MLKNLIMFASDTVVLHSSVMDPHHLDADPNANLDPHHPYADPIGSGSDFSP
jgi:hypothetical protein